MKLAWVVLVAACSADPVPTAPVPVGSCGGLTQNVASEPALHVAPGTEVAWSTNPPVTGSHYPVWAAYDRTYTALDRGYYLHNAEHGSIVFLYNCPDGCPEVVASLEDIVRKLPVDPSCTAPVRNRAIVTGDPLLPTMVGAVAWDNWYTASCVDPYLTTFATNTYGFGPEDLCSDGANFGGTFIDP